MFEMNHFKSIDELVKFFPTEQSCIDFLERQRWGDHVVSPYDPDSKVYKCKGNRYKCKNTGKYFNVRTKHDLREHESVVEEMDVGLLYRHKR